VAATNPKYLSRKDIPAAELDKERQILIDEAKATGKPEEIAKKIVEGKLNNFYSDYCLLDQPFIKDQDRKIGEILTDLVSKIGEKIVISRFVRYELDK
jgi:elongation factor Ts